MIIKINAEIRNDHLKNCFSLLSFYIYQIKKELYNKYISKILQYSVLM